MFVNELVSDKKVPNFKRKVVSANNDDYLDMQEALANWMTFINEPDLLESLDTALVYTAEDFESFFDFILLLDVRADGNCDEDCLDMGQYKATITKQ